MKEFMKKVDKADQNLYNKACIVTGLPLDHLPKKARARL